MAPFNNDPNLELDSNYEPPNRWSVGDRVLAAWDPMWLYAGTVGEVRGNELFIFFDDGDREWNTIGLTRFPATASAAFFGTAMSTILGKYGCLIVIAVVVMLGLLFGWFNR